MARPETLVRHTKSIRKRTTRLLGSAFATMDRSPEAQTRKANDEIVAKVAKAKQRVLSSTIRIKPEILELAGFSMIIIGTEQMEAKGKYPGAHFDLMKDAAQKIRANFIAKNFGDDRLRQEAMNQNHDRQLAKILFELFYDRNPKPNQVVNQIDTHFLTSRTALEELFLRRN